MSEQRGGVVLIILSGAAVLLGVVVLSEKTMESQVEAVPVEGVRTDGGRPPAEVREEGNRLKNEPSLYLRQHAHNPVDWSPWDDEALGRSRREEKPIFLSIGYSSCHWCHVMEEEVFEKDDVAALLNAGFVPIKVDREERPDLDTVYMEATQAMTGSGGWPMSVFLTPDLKPFFAGTYFPHERFLPLLQQVGLAWANRRDEVESQARRVSEALAAASGKALSTKGVVTAGDEGPDWDRVAGDSAASAVERRDPQWGGFMARMKFPSVPVWWFLLRHHRKTGDTRTAEAVRATLDFMGSGGIHDQVGGGFHRYSVDREWLVPHFEKMLYDNAQLARLYLEAFVVFQEPEYQRIARDTLDFLLEEMQGPEGGFHASFDADSGGEEGSYYVWTVDEIKEVAGSRDGPALALMLGADGTGNFEGSNVLTRRYPTEEAAVRLDRDPAELAGLPDRWRQALKERRALRVAPGLDRKVITSWNGLTISALADGWAVTGDDRYLQAAQAAAEFLWKAHRKEDGSLMRSSYGTTAYNTGILDDYAFLAEGFLSLFKATGSLDDLRRAKNLVEGARQRFAAAGGGYYLTPEGHEAPMGRQVDTFDNAVPSGNGVLLNVLVELGALTGDRAYLDEARRALEAYGGLMERAGVEMALWLEAAMKLKGPFYDVVIAGDRKDPATRALRRTFERSRPAHAVLVTVPGGGPDDETLSLLSATRGKSALGGRPTAFVCRFGQCKAPTAEPDVFARQLMEGWSG